MVYTDHHSSQTLMIHGVALTTNGSHNESYYHAALTLKTVDLLLLDKMLQK